MKHRQRQLDPGEPIKAQLCKTLTTTGARFWAFRSLLKWGEELVLFTTLDILHTWRVKSRLCKSSLRQGRLTITLFWSFVYLCFIALFFPTVPKPRHWYFRVVDYPRALLRFQCQAQACFPFDPLPCSDDLKAIEMRGLPFPFSCGSPLEKIFLSR